MHRVRDAVLSVDSTLVDRLVAVGYSLLASIAERRRCRVQKVDGAWLHEWDDGAYLCGRPVRRPITEVTHLYPYFFYRYTPTSGDVVVDAGAGVGTEAIELARLVGSRGRVIAIEAHPPSARLCERVVNHLGLANVTVINAAVTQSSGTVLITDGDAAIANRLADHGVAVSGDTLPRILQSVGVAEVDYLKVNIEGAERMLLLGLQDSSLVIRQICVSCHDFIGGEWFETLDFTRDWLVEHGYTVTVHPPVEGAPYSGYYVYGSLIQPVEDLSSP